MEISAEVSPPAKLGESSSPNLVLGRRIRHFRRARGLTLRELGELVGRQAPYLSGVENGKREPSLSLLGSLADALHVSVGELIDPSPPSRRAELEIALEQVQRDPLWSNELGLPLLVSSPRLPTPVLEAITRLFDELKQRGRVRAQTPEGARRANTDLRRDMAARGNYFAEIEELAARTLEAAGYRGGAVTQSLVSAAARFFGLEVRSVRDLPPSVRSVTDLQNRRIYVSQRNRVGTRLVDSVVVQTLGHFALEHRDPADFGEFLRQRVEANYFAGAMLIPEAEAVPMLLAAKDALDVAVEDLEERFFISYEMAAHRFTNLATRHLGIPVHFVRSDEAGVVWKAYENDGVPFPQDADGAIEGQLLCRRWGARAVFRSEDRFSIHRQYVDTPKGTYWSATYLETGREPHDAITIGTDFDHSRYFRGANESQRAVSGCPDGPCCRRPPPGTLARWAGMAWPSPRPHSHVLAALPAGTFPGVDVSEVYDFLDRHAPA